MILVDTSAWIEYLRGTGSDVGTRVRTYYDNTDVLAITDVVVMELMAGVRTETDERGVDAIVNGVTLLAIAGLDDYVQASLLYRTCRQAGETVRQMTDCLIAAVAIRNGVPLMHQNADFHVLARHTALQVA